jgi:hypothetical protein
MKGKHLILLLLTVALVGAAGYVLQKENRAAWSESGGGGVGAKVIEFPINDVAQVTIKNAGGEVSLVKKGDEWTVAQRADYPASFEQVSDLIRKLWDLKTVQDVKVGKSQFERLELVQPGTGAGVAGTLAEFKDKDGKTLGAVLLGKKYMKKSEGGFGGPDSPGFAAGRYVMPANGAKVSLVSESLDEIDPKPERWLKKDFIKVENPTNIVLEGTSEPQRWTLSRENATSDWKLEGAKEDEKLDNAKVSGFATLFASANFNDVLAPDAKPEETGLDKPATAVITTTDKFTYSLKIGKLNGESFPVTVAVAAEIRKDREPGKDEKPEDKEKLDKEFQANVKRLEEKLASEKKFEGRAYLVAKYTIETLLKDRAGLLAEKKPETTATPPAPGAPAPTAVTAAPAPPAPPKPATSGPITVTTPPVSAPPLPTPPAGEKPPLPSPGDKPVPPPSDKPAPPAPEKPAPPAPPAPDKAAPQPDKPAPPAADKPPTPPPPPPAPEPRPDEPKPN